MSISQYLKNPNIFHKTFLVLTLLYSHITTANWEVVEEKSSVQFISTKNARITEVNSIKGLSGQVGTNGSTFISIPLDKLETNINIRNERLKEHLFQTEKYPTASISTKTDISKIFTLEPGQEHIQDITFTLALHNRTKNYTEKVHIIMLDNYNIHIKTTQPIIVDMADFSLLEGLSVLKKLASLSSITTQVPVTFTLELQPTTLKKAHAP